MKVQNHPEYNPEFPENFNWGLIDSISLTNLANKLANEAKTQLVLIPDQRHLLPGLRLALRYIAEIAKV